MSLSAKLSTMQAKILDKLSQAVQARDIEAISLLSQAAQECDSLQKEASALEEKLRLFESSVSTMIDTIPSTITSTIRPESVDNTGKQLSDGSEAKSRSRDLREEWVIDLQKVHDIRLSMQGKAYLSPSQRVVRVAVANELAGIPNRWFLGMPDKPTDIIVLLCQTLNQEIFDIVIPMEDLGHKWEMLARSNRQVKLHIRKDGNNFLMPIPRSDPILVNQYVGYYDPLR